MTSLDVHQLGDCLMSPPHEGPSFLCAGGRCESDFGTFDDSFSLLLTCQWDVLLTKRGWTTCDATSLQYGVQVIREP